ncbi:MAG: hypothetical protein ACRD8O_01545 [Bryobacteraceae bacterium]
MRSVCLLEFDGLKALVGENKARAIFEHWAGHHYKAIYRKCSTNTTDCAQW